jgi:ABC-type multidrug transport system ATPase subunit
VSQTCEIFTSLVAGKQKKDLGLAFQFRDLDYNVSHVSRSILRGISGHIRRGSMFGIMGPSGAGKCMPLYIFPVEEPTN